ncbi:hypothetical protein [Moritella viscosa]|uniref:Uncharacterized protein n=1 Tax=Moritella viscosa TaxID=80854 RepID=A0ABY1HCU0_9GAMM|nr:hypothetical protein [Moritella viscosa]SGY87198.1 Putative uncharacterized protein [Moritella viscosa]SGY93351.1 Putative uncharacterized protein [Moritella viscosa]SHO28124.1 Putative uncharacterized protein [Moritella viscosa]
MRKNDRKSRVRQIRKSKKTNRKNRIAKAKILNSKKYLDISLRTIIVKHQSEILNNSIDKETIDDPSTTQKVFSDVHSNKKFYLFCSIVSTLIFSYQSEAVNTLIFQSFHAPMTRIVNSIFPSVSDEVYPSYVSLETPTQLAALAQSLDQILLDYVPIVALIFCVLFLLESLTPEGASKGTRSRVIAMLFVLFIASPLNTQEYKTASGHTEQVNNYRYIIQTAFAKVVEAGEKMIDFFDGEDITIHSIQLPDPKVLKDNYLDISHVFLKNVESQQDVLDTKLNVSFKDDAYTARFEMGGSETIISNMSNTIMNQKAETIDEALAEKEMIQDFYQSLFEHSYKVAQNISNTKISYDKELSSDFTDAQNLGHKESVLEGDYKQYCEGIYTYDLSGADMGVMNAYLDVAAQCASHNFLVKHYASPYFDSEEIISGQGALNDLNAMPFGHSVFELDFDDIKAKAKLTCSSGGYFACAEAIQITEKAYVKTNKKLGLITTPVNAINDVVSSYVDISGDVMRRRLHTQTPVKGVGYRDLILDKDAYFSINFTKNIEKQDFEVLHLLQFIDITDIPKPAFSTIVNTIAGSDFMSPINKFTSCYNAFNQIRNGYKCGSVKDEVIDLGTGFIQWGVSFKTGAMLMSFNKKKGKAFKMSSDKLKKYGSAVGTVTAIIAPSAYDNQFKTSSYFSSTGATEILATAAILQYFGLEAIKFLGWLGSVAIGIGFLFYYLVLMLPLTFFKFSLLRAYKFIIDQTIAFNLFFLNGFSRGMDGIESVYDEFIIDLHALFMNFILQVISPIIIISSFTIIFQYLHDILIKIDGNLGTQIMNIIILLFELLAVFLLLRMLPKMMNSQIDKWCDFMKSSLSK